MKRIERILWALFFIGIIFKLNHWPFAGLLTVFSLALVSMFYFYLGFALFNEVKINSLFKKASYENKPKLNVVFGIAFGVALSLLTIGFLFKIMLWPGADMNLTIGFFILGISLISYLVLSNQKQVFFPKHSFLRVFLVGALALSFFLIKTDSIIDLYYGENPEYAEAMKAVNKYPTDIELQEKLHKLREKRYNREVEMIEE